MTNFTLLNKVYPMKYALKSVSGLADVGVPQEVPGSSFFGSDSGSGTVQSRNLVPIPIPRLSMARTRFRVRFRDCTGFELDSDSGSETAQA